jgi:hypothetical protein
MSTSVVASANAASGFTRRSGQAVSAPTKADGAGGCVRVSWRVGPPMRGVGVAALSFEPFAPVRSGSAYRRWRLFSHRP